MPQRGNGTATGGAEGYGVKIFGNYFTMGLYLPHYEQAVPNWNE
jgi:hypothetical protein